MNESDECDPAAGMAALSTCESLLIALNDLKIIDGNETRAILADAAATHRNAVSDSENPEHHRAVAAVIERILGANGSAWKY